MKNLKEELIKIGHQKPELRDHLRPILDVVTKVGSNYASQIMQELRPYDRRDVVENLTTRFDVLIYRNAEEYRIKGGNHDALNGDFSPVDLAIKNSEYLQPGMIWDIFVYNADNAGRIQDLRGNIVLELDGRGGVIVKDNYIY